MNLIILCLLNGLCVESVKEYELDKQFKLSLLFEKSLFFRKVFPNFLSFNETISFDYIIKHYKNIIYKAIDLQTLDDARQEYHFNRLGFESQLYYCNHIIKNRLSKFNQRFNTIDSCKLIESYFYAFLTKKIYFSLYINNNNDLFLDILKEDVEKITNLFTKVSYLKTQIVEKTKSKMFFGPKIDEIITEICDFLINIKKIMNEKFVLSKLMKESYTKYVSEYNTKIHAGTDKLEIGQNNYTIKYRNDIAVFKCFELRDLYKLNIKFKSKHCILEIKDILNRAHDLILKIFQTNFLKLNIDCLFNVYLYCNFMKETIWCKKYKLENNKNLKKFFYKAYMLTPSNLNKTLLFIASYQKILGNFITDFCIRLNRCKLNSVNHYIVLTKYNSFIEFITLEKNNDDLIYLNVTNKSNLQSQFHIFCSCKRIFENYDEIFSVSYDCFNDDFNFFKIQSFLIIRLCSLFFCEQKIQKKRLYPMFETFLHKLIPQYKFLIDKMSVSKLKNATKMTFLIVVLKKLQENANLVGSLKENLKNKDKNIVISDILVVIFKFNIYLYQILNNFFHDSCLLLCKANNTNCKQNFIELTNNKVCLNEYNENKKCSKLKECCQKRYNLFEDNILNTLNFYIEFNF
ncbi:hypothetical protein NUSPORA_00895 [Nucleospora cyclopteri]